MPRFKELALILRSVTGPRREWRSRSIGGTIRSVRGVEMLIQLTKIAVLVSSLVIFSVCDMSRRPAEDKASLDSAITAANEIYNAAVEGTGHGQFTTYSKKRYLLLTNRARRVAKNPYATQAEVDRALKYLGVATTVFQTQAIDTTDEIFSGAVIDSIMIERATIEHLFTFTLKTDNTYTLFDTVAALGAKVFLQLGNWEANENTRTFTSTLCKTLDLVSLRMVLDTIMAPYSGEIKGDTMTIDEFGYLGSASFYKQ